MNNNDWVKATLSYMRKQVTQQTIATQTMESLMATTFRMPPDKIYIKCLKNSCPAFMFWLEKLNAGERLPRGKYFRRHGLLKRKIKGDN
ncbi:hypothetical protein JJL91_002599 [Salmonella enterica]|nr:hypothetical protein [Salmonella enterica]